VLLDFCYQENHSTGQLLRSSAENLMVELGFPKAIFELNYKKYNKLATRAWMKCTWQFCNEFKITMHTTIPKLEPQCPDDQFLMPVFAAKCNASLLPQLNIFRKYLQVITLAEIVTADGKYITRAAWEGHRDASRITKYNWPEQHRPSDSHWQLFRDALQRCFNVSAQRQLQQPMQWDVNPAASSPWQFFWNPADERLYRRQKEGWTAHAHTGTGKRMRQTKYSGFPVADVPSLPSGARKATVDIRGLNFIVTGIHRHPEATAQSLSFTPDGLTYLCQLPLA
jgi:hypothetical protein